MTLYSRLCFPCIVHFDQRPFCNKMKLNIPSSMRTQQVPPPIPLKPASEGGNSSSNKKADTLKLEIKTQPGDAHSETVTLTVGILKDGSPEELLKFKTKLAKIIKGQGLTTGPAQYAMTKNLLAGEALRVFEIEATKAGAETIAHHPVVVNAMIKHFFPSKALIWQKRYMR